MVVNNVNPCNLLDAIIKNNIQIENNYLESDLVVGETIAKNITVNLVNKTDKEKVNEIIKNLDNSTVVQASEQQILNAQLLQANAQQQLLNASLLKQVAELKGGNA
ncbi:hypothetical protein ACQPUR_03400 [Clostridium neonatale]|uniref:hypothetical protein n=1 Tax=Clostridium neonatale TaxID=137838 RepID=UPI003D347B35